MTLNIESAVNLLPTLNKWLFRSTLLLFKRHFKLT